MARFQVQHTTAAANLYALFRNADGLIWNGAAFETYVTANLGNYDFPLTEQGTASRYYTAVVPGLVPPGVYFATYYVRAGGSPAEGDTLIKSEQLPFNPL